MLEMLSVIDPGFILMVLAGSVAGLFVGAIPGLSVSMATALLVSITYTWEHSDALAMIMGVYVVGVFSGAVSAILINIPGAPSSVVTTLDGYPMSRKGQAYKALYTATIYSFTGSLFGLLALALLATPVSRVALKFTKMDYFLLALFGLATVGSVSTKNYAKGLISVMIGLVISMIGLDPLMGTRRLTFGVQNLTGGISTVPALVGFFGFAEVLSVIYNLNQEQNVLGMERTRISLKEVLKHWKLSLYTSTIGMLVGALPGAGGPVASFIAYNEAKRLVKNPDVPFGEGAVEGIMASESSNNACIGGALIPMLTLAVPGDAVTAIILSVFYVHGLQPGPMFIRQNPEAFHSILAAGFIACFALLVLGLLVAPRICRVITIPKNIMIPVVASLCVIGSFACNNRLFDVALMFLFGLIGFLMRRFDYPVAPLILAMVLGKMMDSNFRQAVSLALAADNPLKSMFWHPVTIILSICTMAVLLGNIPWTKRYLEWALGGFRKKQ
ncbi:MAG: tripartite tricarboxylate transporter permease [Lachnospiraceae bacterium]|nr:tripartite tricarboxylate transporter permease [Lachnospiraceae bacterium]